MNQKRFIELQAQVLESVARLTEAATETESELIRDATIQRFEFTFELVWKSLKLYLQHLGHECNSPRSTFKKAFTERLIPTLEEANCWLQMLDNRNITTHAYDQALARKIYKEIVSSYAPLLRIMADRIQRLDWN